MSNIDEYDARKADSQSIRERRHYAWEDEADAGR